MNPTAGPAVSQFLPTGKAGNIIKIVLIGAVVLLVVYVLYKTFTGVSGAIDSVLEDLHLKDDPATVAAKQAVQAAINVSTSGSANAWSPVFHEGCPEGTILPTSASAQAIAEQIYDSVGSFYDSPEDGLAAIKECQNKAAVSWIVDMFNQQYQKDLLSWLQQKYDTRNQLDILSQITTYVSNLPNYSY